MNASKIRVANAPCSWGLIGQGPESQPSDFRVVLDEIARAGYAGTELGDWGFMPTEPKALADELSKRSLTMLGAFVGVEFAYARNHAEGREIAVRTAKLLAAVAPEAIVVLADQDSRDPTRTKLAGRITAAHALDDARFHTFASGVNEVARAVFEETGLRSVFHHHAAGWIETPHEVERLLEATDERMVGLCLDTGHFTFGGGDPVAAYKKHAKRVWHVHFKDFSSKIMQKVRDEDLPYIDAVRSGIYCELGTGTVDFPAFAAELDAHGYEGWIVVEQDVIHGLGTPLESARRNREYVARLGL